MTGWLFTLMGLFLVAHGVEIIEQDVLNAAAESQFHAIMGQNRAPLQAGSGARPVHVVQSHDPQIEVELARYEEVREALIDVREQAGQPSPPRVVLGSASYHAEAVERGLALSVEVKVHATLRGDGAYKVVPLVGEDAVLVGAADANGPIAVTRDNGYHVWVTQRTGEVDLLLELLVAPDGPRGSIEYDFLVPMTPVTRFSFTYDDPSLEPRVTGAVRRVHKATETGARLEADLAPTARVRLVGFRSLQGEGRRAHLYSEALNLLSVDQGTAELFTVFRYNILYAGRRNFDVFVPDGFDVISAEGRGAFRYRLEPADGGQLLRGETAYPIRDDYEISLRLRRQFDAGVLAMEAPRTLGAEREVGWIGAEVTGRLLLAEGSAKLLTPVDVRQLPAEMVHSAVSPILRAYRYHDPEASLELGAVALPEREVRSAAVDRLDATTVINDSGVALTDLRITTRNHLRHSLAITLPQGARVRSTLLDGAPVKPSQTPDGELLLPLKRSGCAPFTVQVFIEDHLPELGWWGTLEPRLPELELPVHTVAWDLHVPDGHRYSPIRADIQPQRYARGARWVQSNDDVPVNSSLPGSRSPA